MTSITGGRFEIGRVVSNTFAVLGRNAAPFFLLAFILSGLPAFLQQVLAGSFGAQGGLPQFGAMFAVNLIFGLVKLVLAFVLQGALVVGAIADLNGKRIDLGAMLARGGEVVLPLFGLAILEGLAIAFGFLLLIIPGLILLTMWAVTVPALVIERTGVFGAFSRSGDLTRNNRWAVFGLLIAYAVVVWVISAISGGIMFAINGGLSGLSNAVNYGASIPMAIFVALIGTIFGAISAAGIAVLYYELRLAKEGVAPQAIYETFA